MAEALYRKYRPQVFEDVVGQEPIERTLKNAIAQDKVSHAYLFTGPRGTGKTTSARLLAKALLCQAGPTPNPDGTCEDCELIAEGMHPDVYELDAASRTGVENVREEIISRVSFAPTRGRFKVYIIDEVHMLSTAAFNALLKTLEEPPSHVVFVLCTTDPQKVPETIHSRCQRFDFRRIVPEAIVARLGAICIAENVEFEGEALDLIAHRAEGGLRNALTSLEQIIAFEDGKVTLAGAERLLGSIDSNDMAEIISSVGERDIASCFRWTAAYVETGADLAQFVRDMAEHVRNLYVMALVGEDVEIDVGETSRLELANELQWFGPDRLARLLGVLGDLIAELKTSSNPRLAFEIALTRMVRPDSDLTLESLAERVEALESGYSAVAHVLPGRPYNAAPEVEGAFDMTAASPEPSPVAERSSAGMRPADRPSGLSGSPDAAQAAASAAAAFAPATAAATSASPAQGAPQAAGGVTAGSDKLAALSNPAALQRIWQAALSGIKRQKQSYGVLFMNTKAHFDAEQGLVKVTFPAESTFAFNTAQKPDVQDALAAALEKACGAPVPFAYVRAGQDSAVSAGPSAAAQAASAPAHDASAVAQAVQAGPASVQAARPDDRSAQVSPAPDPAGQAPRQDAPPYEEVPYEEVPYEQVPYEELDGPFSQPASQQPPAQAAPDSAGAPSAARANLTPDGALAEDPADVEALLQAGFGGGVVFSEIEEDA